MPALAARIVVDADAMAADRAPWHLDDLHRLASARRRKDVPDPRAQADDDQPIA